MTQPILAKQLSFEFVGLSIVTKCNSNTSVIAIFIIALHPITNINLTTNSINTLSTDVGYSW